jgi:hypothetical protein
MKNVSRMVHPILEGAIEVGEGFGAAAEAQIIAEVISAL